MISIISRMMDVMNVNTNVMRHVHNVSMVDVRHVNLAGIRERELVFLYVEIVY